MPECTCTFCSPQKKFKSKEELKEHILQEHMDKILELLSKIPEYRRKNIRNPKGFAAGLLAAWQCSDKSNSLEENEVYILDPSLFSDIKSLDFVEYLIREYRGRVFIPYTFSYEIQERNTQNIRHILRAFSYASPKTINLVIGRLVENIPPLIEKTYKEIVYPPVRSTNELYMWMDQKSRSLLELGIDVENIRDDFIKEIVFQEIVFLQEHSMLISKNKIFKRYFQKAKISILEIAEDIKNELGPIFHKLVSKKEQLSKKYWYKRTLEGAILLNKLLDFMGVWDLCNLPILKLLGIITIVIFDNKVLSHTLIDFVKDTL